MKTKREAMVGLVILRTMLERFEQGETMISIATLKEAVGLRPNDADYDTFYELTEQFFAEKEGLLEGMEANALGIAH